MASVSQDEIPQISHSELTDLVAIGEGGFAVAYRAKHAGFGTVVYKELKAQKLGDRKCHELEKEARMHFLRHANIVELRAMVLETGHYGIVLEYVLHGSLRDFNYAVDWPLKLSLAQKKLSLAHDIVRGMKYLHSQEPPVIHSDLKPENVLVSGEFVAKICDFGLAKWKHYAATQTATKERRGTIVYMAPEVLEDPSTSRTTAFDVYSFGILLWELLSGQEPFPNAVTIEQIITAVVNGDRPPLDAIKGNADLVSFAKIWIPQCWHKSPDERPTFNDLERPFAEIRQIQAANQ